MSFCFTVASSRKKETLICFYLFCSNTFQTKCTSELPKANMPGKLCVLNKPRRQKSIAAISTIHRVVHFVKSASKLKLTPFAKRPVLCNRAGNNGNKYLELKSRSSYGTHLGWASLAIYIFLGRCARPKSTNGFEIAFPYVILLSSLKFKAGR